MICSIVINRVLIFFLTIIKKVKKKDFSTESKNLEKGHFKMSIFGFMKKVWKFVEFFHFLLFK